MPRRARMPARAALVAVLPITIASRRLVSNLAWLSRTARAIPVCRMPVRAW